MTLLQCGVLFSLWTIILVASSVFLLRLQRNDIIKLTQDLNEVKQDYLNARESNEVFHNHIRDSRRRLYEDNNPNSTKVLNDLYLLALGKCYDKDLRRAVLHWKTRHGVLNNIGEE
jgi:hypothetical protein